MEDVILVMGGRMRLRQHGGAAPSIKVRLRQDFMMAALQCTNTYRADLYLL